LHFSVLSKIYETFQNRIRTNCDTIAGNKGSVNMVLLACSKQMRCPP
jgi:hypothetical protein